MQLIRRLSIALLSGILLTACSGSKKLATFAPEPDTNDPLVYDVQTSFVSVPISLKLRDIENQANKYVTSAIYDDNSLEKDNLEIHVYKQAPFRISNVNGKIQTILPLKVNGKFRYGTSALGIDLYDTRGFNLAGEITLQSDVAINNWKLSTNTAIVDVNWTESPSITMAGKNIPLTYLINPALKIFRKDIEQAIDKAILDAADFKPQVMDALSQLSSPILMDPQYQAWFKLTPIELYTTKASLKQDAIRLNMGLKCNMETYIGKQPEKSFDKNKLVLKSVETMPDKISLSIAAVSSYDNVSNIINKNLSGQEFVSGKRKVKVNDVKLWQKAGKLIVAVDLSGTINGKIYLSGLPRYNREKQEIFVDELDYVVDTKDKLTKSASWLLEGFIIKKIQENCRYSIKAEIEAGKKDLQPFLKNYSPGQGVKINGTLESLDFDDIKLSNKAIVAFVKAVGTMDVMIDGL